MEKKNKRKVNKALNFNILIGLPYILITIILVVLPLGIMLLYSFTKSLNGFDITFTFDHYKNFFIEPQFVKTMLKSLWIALLTTSICLVIGYPLAYLISRIKGHLQVLLILLINAPMWINMLLRVRSIQQLLDIFSPTLYETDFALIFGMVYLFLPFMVLPIYTVLSKLDENYFEGAADLGANRFQTIQRVIIPLSLSGIISGVIMVFLPAATTLVVPQYLGKNVHFIGNVIEASITQQINGGYGYGAAISLVLSLIIVLMVFGMKKADKYQSGSNKDL